jgi:branched-chain amino acid transport system ATP-binding protein
VNERLSGGTSLLVIRDLYKKFGGLVATDHFSLEVPRGELHAVIGPNGAGKTTLIALVAGQLQRTAGEIWFDGSNITEMSLPARAQRGLVRSYQITSEFLAYAVLENILIAVQARDGSSFRFWRDARRDPALVERAQHALHLVGLVGRDEVLAGELSHGERRQLEIAMALATRPRMLLLDEPLAGLGLEETEDLVRLIDGLKNRETILLVEHDIDVVFALADRISVMVSGRSIACGTASEIRNDPEVRRAYLGEA